jgi:hypothetical protein
MDHLTLVVEKALEWASLKYRVGQLQKEVDSPYATIVGEGPMMQDLALLI